MDPSASIVQVIAALAVTLLLVFALAYLVRRASGQALTGRGGSIRVLGATALGAKERLLIVDAAGEHLLLGVTSEAITLLHRYPDGVGELGETPAEQFASVFNRVLRR